MTVALVVATTAARDGVFGPANGAAQGATPGAVAAGPGGAAPAGSGSAAPAGDRESVRAGDAGSAGTRSGNGANGAMRVKASTGLRAAALPLPWLHGGEVTAQPLLTRLCGQLGALGVTDIVLIVPPGDADTLAAMAWDGLSLPGPLRRNGLTGAANLDVIGCASVAEELRAVASVARDAAACGDAVLCCAGDVVAHTEALARICRSARTSALTAVGVAREAAISPDLRPALRLAGRGQLSVAAAGSAFHRVSAPNAVGCGVVLVSPRDGDELAAAADELAVLARRDPGTHKGEDSRRAEPASRHASTEEPDRAVAAGAAGAAAAPAVRQAARCPAPGYRPGFTDSMALLLVGLVRSGVAVEAVDIGPLVCMRAQSADQARTAAAELSAVDEDRVRLNAAVSYGGGLVATRIVDPYVKHFARWAHRRRQLNPNALTGMSFGLGVLAALWFSAGSAAGMILGAVFGFAAFVLGRADGQLARYARKQTEFGGWLGGTLGRLSEYAIYAGLAAGAAGSAGAAGVIGAGRSAMAAITPPLPRGVWGLAVAAMILQALRDVAGLSVRACATQMTPRHGLPRRSGPAGVPGNSGHGIIPGKTRMLPFDEPADFAVPASAVIGKASAGPAGNGRYGARARRHRGSGRLARLAGAARGAARRAVGWLAEIIGFDQGERVAVMGLTAVVAGARMTFAVLLAWGLLAGAVRCVTALTRSVVSPRSASAPSVPGRPASVPGRPVSPRRVPVPGGGPFAGSDQSVATCRDDGILATVLGRFVNGQLPPLPPALASVTVTIILCVAGVAKVHGALVLAPVVAMALAAVGSAHPHDRRLDWLVPPLLQLGEYVFLVALALGRDVPLPLLFILICAIAAHHHHVANAVRPGAATAGAGQPAGWARDSAPRMRGAACLGWEGRMLAAAIGAVLGIEVFAFAVLAVYLWVLFGWQSLTGWVAATHRPQRSPRTALGGAGDVAARTGSWESASPGRQPPRWPGAPGSADFEDGGGR